MDAEARALTTGDDAVVGSAHGEVHATVEVTDRISRGTVSLTHGVSGVDVNQLTSDVDVDPVTGMPRFSGFAVEVRRLEVLTPVA